MGYYTTVSGELVIKPESVPQLLADIEKAKEKIRFYDEWNEKRWKEVSPPLTEKQREALYEEGKKLEASYFDYHKADTRLEENYISSTDGVMTKAWILTPPEDDIKWYGMLEYLEWITDKVAYGLFQWCGEERDDIGAYKWTPDGKIFEQELEWKEMKR